MGIVTKNFVYDTFTGSPLNSAKWTTIVGTGTVVQANNRLEITGTSAWNANGVISKIPFTRGSGASVTAKVRYQSGGNPMTTLQPLNTSLSYSTGISFGFTNGDLGYVFADGGAGYEVFRGNENTWYTLKFEFVGSNGWKVYVNDVSVWSGTTAAATTYYLALQNYSTLACYFDDVSYVASYNVTQVVGSQQVQDASINGTKMDSTSTYAFGPVTATAIEARQYKGIDQITEKPVGITDGTNKTFVLNNIASLYSLQVIRNGLVQSNDSYEVTGDRSITFNVAPANGDTVRAAYLVADRLAWPSFPEANPGTVPANVFIDAQGFIWAQGLNSGGAVGNGSVGDNTTINRSSPVAVAGHRIFKKVLAVAVGQAWECNACWGITEDGSVYGWIGYIQPGAYWNESPGVGDNSGVNRSSPVSIARPGSYSQIGYASVIDGATGQVFTWGAGQNNGAPPMPGDNTLNFRSSPVSIARPGSYSAVFRASVSGPGFVIDAANGSLWGWGTNSLGEVGDNTTTGRSSPISVLMVPPVRSVLLSFGYYGPSVHAIDQYGNVWSWGCSDYGRLGNGTTTGTNPSSPIAILRSSSYSKVVSSGINTTAFLDGVDGSIWTTGSGGELGTNNGTAVSSPVSIARPGSYSKIVASNFYCSDDGSSYAYWAIDGATGMIYSWGRNTHGRLGDNTTTNRSSPVAIARYGSYKDIMLGRGHSLFAIDAVTNIIYAWGYNVNGELGDNTTINRSSPVSIARILF